MSNLDIFMLSEILLRQTQELGLQATENAVILLQTVLYKETKRNTDRTVCKDLILKPIREIGIKL